MDISFYQDLSGFNVGYFIEHIGEFYDDFVTQNKGNGSGYDRDYDENYNFNWGEYINELFK